MNIFANKRIRKIKASRNSVELEVIETWGAANEREWRLKCHEEPAQEFLDSLDALAPLVRDLLGLPTAWADQALHCVSVSFSWSETTAVEGASICMRADLDCATAPLIFNTPHLPFDQYSPGGEQPVMPDDLIEALQAVKIEAQAYLDGKRMQGDLFADAPKDGKAAAAGELADA